MPSCLTLATGTWSPTTISGTTHLLSTPHISRPIHAQQLKTLFAPYFLCIYEISYHFLHAVRIKAVHLPLMLSGRHKSQKYLTRFPSEYQIERRYRLHHRHYPHPSFSGVIAELATALKVYTLSSITVSTVPSVHAVFATEKRQSTPSCSATSRRALFLICFAVSLTHTRRTPITEHHYSSILAATFIVHVAVCSI